MSGFRFNTSANDASKRFVAGDRVQGTQVAIARGLMRAGVPATVLQDQNGQPVVIIRIDGAGPADRSRLHEQYLEYAR